MTRTEDVWHAVGSIIVPILLLVMIPVLGAVYVANRNQYDQIKGAQVAACERGNAVRIVLNVLAESQLDDLLAASQNAASHKLRVRDAELYQRLNDTLSDSQIAPLLRVVSCK